MASIRRRPGRIRPRVRTRVAGYPPAVSRISTLLATAAPAQAPTKGALTDFLEDIDSLFVPPIPLPPPADRARALADRIDWTQPTIVIWVPGTNGHDVPEKVQARLRAAKGPAAYAIDYTSTWQLRTSVPDGEAALRELLQLVARRKRAGQRVVLLGESQGAWVISSVLRDPALAAVVDRAALVAHPALAPAHVHDSTSVEDRLDPSRTREFNRPGDVVTRELGASAPRVLDVVHDFASLEVGRALRGALTIAFTDFGVLQALVASQLFRVEGKQNPHASADLLADAVAWVLGRSGAPAGDL